MPLSERLRNSLLELQSINDQLTFNESVIEDDLRASGVKPETATIEDFQSLGNTQVLDDPFIGDNEQSIVESSVSAPVENQEPEFEVVEPETDSALDFSIDQAQKLFGSGVQTFGDLFGSDTLVEFGKEYVEEQERDIARGGYVSKYTGSFADTLGGDGIVAGLGWIWEKAQENLASGGAVIIGTGAAVLAAPVAVAAGATATTGAAIGSVIGATTLAGGVVLGVGEVREELEQKGVYDKDDAISAVGAGVAIGLLDRVGAGKVINKGGAIKGIFETGAVKQLGKSAAAEFGTEAAQELAIVGTAALNGAEYTIPEVLNRAIDAGVVGGALGLGASTIQAGGQSVRNATSNTENGNANDNGTERSGESDGIESSRNEGQDDITQDNGPEGSRDGDEVNASGSVSQSGDVDEQSLDGDNNSNDGQERLLSEESKGEVDTSQPLSDQKEKVESSFVPEVFGKKTGYVSFESATKNGVPRAGETPTDVVERGGRFFVESVEVVETPQALGSNSIPAFASKTVDAREQSDALGNEAFDLYSSLLENRTRVGDRLESIVNVTESVLQQIGITKNQLTPSINEKLQRISELREQDQSDPAVGAAIQSLEVGIRNLRDAGSSEFFKKARRIASIDIGARFPDKVKDAQLNRVSGRATVEGQITNSVLIYNEAVSESIKGSDNPESLRQSYNELLDKVIVDSSASVRFKLVDGDQGLHPDNIVTNEAGDLVYTIDGVEHNAPTALREPLLEFIRLNQQERSFLEKTYFPRQRRVLESDYEAAIESVVASEEALNAAIDSSGGTDGLQYAAFDSESSGKDWIKSLVGEDAIGGDSPLTSSVLLDGLTEFISRKVGDDADAYSERIQSFTSSIESSKSISEFHEATEGFFLSESGSTPSSVAAALGGFENKQGLRALYKNLLDERTTGRMLEKHLDFIDQFESNPFHVSRSYEAYDGDVSDFLRSRRNPKTDSEKQIVDNYRNFLQERIGTAYGLESNDSSVVAEAQRVINRKLAEIDTVPNNSASNYRLGPDAGTQYAGIFQKRGNVSAEERAFLGEITDPVKRIAHSVNRLARFRLNNQYANSIIQSSLGSGVFASREDAVAAGVSAPVEIKIADPANFNKLQGMYATEEMSYILDTIDSAGVYDTGIGGFLHTLSGATKLSLTVLDPAVGAANAISGAGIVAQNLPLLRDNFDLVVDAYQQALDKALGKSNTIDLKAELGIAGGSARVQDITAQTQISGDIIKRMFQVLDQALPEGLNSEDGVANKPFTRAYTGWTGMMMSLHKLGDEVPQKVIYNARFRTAQNYYGMNVFNANKYATDYARKTGIYAPYSPSAVKQLQKFPFVGGGFVGWYTGMLISAKEQVSSLNREFIMSSDRYGRLNIPNYDRSNIEMVRQARQEFRFSKDMLSSPVGAGLFGVAGAVFMPSVVGLGVASVVGGLGSLLGDDDEEIKVFDPQMEEMIGRLSPEYYANIDRQFTNIASDGKSVEYFNVSRLGNYGIFGEVLNQVFNADPEETPSEVVFKAMGALTSPFLSPTFGLTTISEAITGRDDFGNEIYKEDDTYLEKTLKASAHVGASTFGNGFYRDGVAVARSLVSDEDFNKFNGQEVELGDFVQRLAGFKPIKFDVVKGLQQRAWEQDRILRSAKKKFTSSVFTFNQLGESSLSNKLTDVQKASDRYFETLISKVEAARYFGLSDDEIAKSLSTAGVSGYKKAKDGKPSQIGGNIQLILRGRKPAYTFPEKSAENVLKKFSERNIPAEARRNLQTNIDAARRIVNGG